MFSFFVWNGEEVVFNGMMPSVMQDVNNLSRSKVHKNQGIFLFFRNINMYFINGKKLRKS